MSDAVKEAACRVLLNMRQSNQRCLAKREFDKVRKTLQRTMQKTLQKVARAEARVTCSLGAQHGKWTSRSHKLSDAFDARLVQEGTPRLVICPSHPHLKKGMACGLFLAGEDTKATFHVLSAQEAKESWPTDSTCLCAVLCVRASLDVEVEYQLNELSDLDFRTFALEFNELLAVGGRHGDLFGEDEVFGKEEAENLLMTELIDLEAGGWQCAFSPDRSRYHKDTDWVCRSERTDFSQCVFLPREHLDKLDQLLL